MCTGATGTTCFSFVEKFCPACVTIVKVSDPPDNPPTWVGLGVLNLLQIVRPLVPRFLQLTCTAFFTIDLFRVFYN